MNDRKYWVQDKRVYHAQIGRDRNRPYVVGERFRHCKYLFLVIPSSEGAEQVDSIDEAAELYSHEMEGIITEGEEPPTPEDYGLTPEEVFWGHASNLQAWAEHEYDTRLIHSNLAFPLLKKLKEVGDMKARKVYIDELASRYAYATDTVKEFLEVEGFISEVFSEDDAIRLRLTDDDYDTLRTIADQTGVDYKSLFRGRTKTKNLRITELRDIRGYPKELLELKDSLTHLGIWGNTGEIPDWIGELRHLKTLEIEMSYHHCESCLLPDSIGELTDLEELILTSNNLTALPDSIGTLEKLKTLKLNNNKLKHLPDSVGYLEKLETLILSDNKLKQLPESVGTLTSLKELSIDDNLFTTIPSCISFLHKLETLDVDHNPLGHIAGWTLRLHSLKSLWIPAKFSYLKEKNKKRELTIRC